MRMSRAVPDRNTMRLRAAAGALLLAAICAFGYIIVLDNEQRGDQEVVPTSATAVQICEREGKRAADDSCEGTPKAGHRWVWIIRPTNAKSRETLPAVGKSLDQSQIIRMATGNPGGSVVRVPESGARWR